MKWVCSCLSPVPFLRSIGSFSPEFPSNAEGAALLRPERVTAIRGQPQLLSRTMTIETRFLNTCSQRTNVYNWSCKQIGSGFFTSPDVAGEQNGLRGQPQFNMRSGGTDHRARGDRHPTQTRPELAFERVQAPTRSPWQIFPLERHPQG